MTETQEKYDVVISFAEEDRAYADAFDARLTAGGLKVYTYFNKFFETAGEPLDQKLVDIYTRYSRFAIVLISSHYLNDTKKFVPIEIDAINKRRNEQGNYVFPIFLEDGLVEQANQKLHGIGQVGYLEFFRAMNTEEIVKEIIKKLKKKNGAEVNDLKVAINYEVVTLRTVNSSNSNSNNNSNIHSNNNSNNKTTNFNIAGGVGQIHKNDKAIYNKNNRDGK
ncbi:MAG: hypothetical protein JWO03_1708 [Bacteroidetes bacterium]|nr:hypothetical protein [Bacteroidota bacterium]